MIHFLLFLEWQFVLPIIERDTHGNLSLSFSYHQTQKHPRETLHFPNALLDDNSHYKHFEHVFTFELYNKHSRIMILYSLGT